MLAVLFPGTRKTILGTTQIKDAHTKHGPGETTNLNYAAILEATLLWKRMIEIWQEYGSFQITSQRLVDQVKTIIKKGWFYDLEILEIHQKINNEQNSNTIWDTQSIDTKTV